MKNLMVCLLVFTAGNLLQAQELDFEWAQKMGLSSGNEKGLEIAVDALGNTMVLGSFEVLMDLDPASGNFVVDGGERTAFFLAFWNFSNVLERVLVLGGENETLTPTGMALDAAGNILICGHFKGSFDADHGSSTTILTSQGNKDGFLIKLGPEGQFLWARQIGGVLTDLQDVVADAAGNVVVTGSAQGQVDFDPGPGVDLINDSNSYAFTLKLDTNGNHLWVKVLTSSNGAFGQCLAVDHQGYILTSGNFRGTADLDPGSGTQMVQSNQFQDIYLQKLDANGQLFWARAYGTDVPVKLAVDAQNNIYTTGYFDGFGDFDPGLNAKILSSQGFYDVFVQKMSPNADFLWAASFGGLENDRPYALDVDEVGNMYTAGSYFRTTYYDPGGTGGAFNTVDVFVQKWTSTGTVVWEKRIGGAGTDQPGGLALNGDEIALTGFFEQEVDLDPLATQQIAVSKGGFDVFVLTLGVSNSAYKWSTTMGMSGGSCSNHDITTDEVGNIFTTGYFTGEAYADPAPASNLLQSKGGQDVFIRKHDPEGKLLWAFGLGGAGKDYGTAVLSDAQGNVWVAGTFSGMVDFDPGTGVVVRGENGRIGWFVLSLDAQGLFRSVSTMVGSGDAIPWEMVFDAEGNLYLIGEFFSFMDFDPGAAIDSRVSNGDNDIAILKLDRLGNFLWVKTMGGTGSDVGKNIAVDQQGRVVIGGVFSGMVDFDPGPATVALDGGVGKDAFLGKIDKDGNFLWIKNVGSPSSDLLSPTMLLAADGGVYLGGGFVKIMDADPGPGIFNLTTTTNLNSDFDAYLIKTDPNGELEKAWVFGDAYLDHIESLSTDGSGNVYVGGKYRGTVDFNLSDTAGNFLTANIDRPFILKLDTSHAFVWVIDFSTSFVPFDTRVHVNHRYQLFTSGYFTGEIDCDPGQDTVALYSTARNTYLIKFSQGYVDPDEEAPTKTFRVWPNPTDGLMYINLGKTMESVMATVTAVDGKLMFEQQFQSTAQLELSFENLPRGVYFVTIKGDGLRETVRVVKK